MTCGPERQHQPARAVVGARVLHVDRRVRGLLHAPAELREHERGHVVVDPAGLEVGLERAERARELLELRVLALELVGVGVEPAPVDRDDARAEVGGEQVRGGAQAARERVRVRVVRVRRRRAAAPWSALVRRRTSSPYVAARALQVRVVAGRRSASARSFIAGLRFTPLDPPKFDAFIVKPAIGSERDRAHRVHRRADRLRQRGVDRDRLQRVGRAAVAVDPAAEPAGLVVQVVAGLEPDVRVVEVAERCTSARRPRASPRGPSRRRRCRRRRACRSRSWRRRCHRRRTSETTALANATRRLAGPVSGGSRPGSPCSGRRCGRCSGARWRRRCSWPRGRVTRAVGQDDVEAVVAAGQVEQDEALPGGASAASATDSQTSPQPSSLAA